jgi:hypothetical protein
MGNLLETKIAGVEVGGIRGYNEKERRSRGSPLRYFQEFAALR